jgi:hypothetical protein
MLFIGYSLTDEDFNAIVHQVRLARGRRSSADQPRLGTVVTLFDDDLFAQLWSDDLEVVALSAAPSDPDQPTRDEIMEASRRLAIFLDLVAFESARSAAYLLDPSYQGMLTPGEESLRVALEQLRTASQRASSSDGDVADWVPVQHFLDSYWST